MVNLPAGITTWLFDLDGVLTQTAKIHAQAWKEMLDAFLRDWADRHGEAFDAFSRTGADHRGKAFEPSDGPTDYEDYVDGKPRLDGVRSSLESRGIRLP